MGLRPRVREARVWSSAKNIAKTCLPPSIHRCSVHLRYCTFRFVQLRKYSPNSRCRLSSCLLAVLVMFLAMFSPSSYSWNEWNVRHFFKFPTKTTQPCPQVFSVNGALTCEKLHFWRHFLVKVKFLPNLVNSNWLWGIKRVLLANQNRGNILNE